MTQHSKPRHSEHTRREVPTPVGPPRLLIPSPEQLDAAFKKFEDAHEVINDGVCTNCKRMTESMANSDLMLKLIAENQNMILNLMRETGRTRDVETLKRDLPRLLAMIMQECIQIGLLVEKGK